MSRSIVVKPIPHISTPILGAAVSLLLCCGLLPTNSDAALVTLQVSFYGDYLSRNESYDGLFVFNYEDSTPDTNPDLDHGAYNNPILSAQITMDGRTSPDHSLFVLDPTIGTTIRIGPKKVGANATIYARFLESDSNIPYDLSVNIETYRLPNDGLSSLIGMRRDDDCATTFRRADGESSWFSQQVCESGAFTLVPLPPAVWLFGSALGLMGAMRRKVSS